MHAAVCVLIITILKYIFFPFFQKHSLLCVLIHFIPTPLFISNFYPFKGRYARTHAHTHTTLKLMSKTGRRLGRELYHPTRPAGTLVRYPHHLIVWQPIRYVHQRTEPSICQQNEPRRWLSRTRRLKAYLHIIGKRGKPKMLSRVPTGIQYACECLCPTHIHFKILFLSFLFNTFSTVRLSSF